MGNLENEINTNDNSKKNLPENIYMNPQEVFKNTKDAVMPDAVKNGTTFYGTSKKTDFEKRMYGEKDGDTKSQSKEKLKEKKKAGGLGILFYFFGLVIVAVSLITLKINVISSLLGAGILVLPLSLIFAITRKKNFFWYSVFAYLCFIVAGLSQKALFASLGILFASLIFGGTILYQKDKENVEATYSITLYLLFQVFIIRFFTSFLDEKIVSPAIIYNLLYISSVLLFVIGVTVSKNKKETNTIDKLSIKNVFWISVGSVMLIYGLIINSISKNKSFIVVNMIIVSIVTAINIWIIISANVKKEVRDIWIYYVILVFIQAMLRPMKILTAVITFACAIVMVVSIVRGFMKKQKTQCQNGIIVLTVLLIWIIVVDTHDYSIIMRSLVNLFCVIVAFTSIVLYNLLGKRIFGPNENSGAENAINRAQMQNSNMNWMQGGYNQNVGRTYENNYGNGMPNGNMNTSSTGNYGYINGMPNANVNMAPIGNYGYTNGMPSANVNTAPTGNYGYINGMPNANMNMAPIGNYGYTNGMPNANVNMAPIGNYGYTNGMPNANVNMVPTGNYGYINGMPNGNTNIASGVNYMYGNNPQMANQNINNN